MPGDEPIIRAEFLEIIRRLDERISSLDRNMTELRHDMRNIQNWIVGLYLFVITVAGVSVAVAVALK
jgi:hypothetical protein